MDGGGAAAKLAALRDSLALDVASQAWEAERAVVSVVQVPETKKPLPGSRMRKPGR